MKRKVILWTLLIAIASPVHATKLLHRNAAELATLANRIFIGNCISIENKNMTIQGHSMLVTEYTFQVTQGLKGVTGQTLVFRQFRSTQGAGAVVGMPEYQKGKNYMLFLGKDSDYGLTSPIGLGQGAFIVITDNSGTTRAVNFFGNQGLFKNMSSGTLLGKKASYSKAEKSLLQKTSGPVDTASFVSLVKKLIE